MHDDAWQESHLGDWIKLLSGGTPPKSDASLWGGSIPWISCKDMKVSLLDSSRDWLTEAGASKVRKVPSGTILIVVRGMILANEFPVARCLMDVTFNQDLKAVIPREGLDEGFLFQWLRGNSYEILGRVDEAGHGTKRLQTDRLLSVPLRLPPLPTQRRIASILSAYDDLIENNTKRIEILEEMARSLYREWFVHFRFPGHEKVKLVDSELGKIPEGWEVNRLDECFVMQRGFDLPKDSRMDGEVPIIASTGITGFHNEAKAHGPAIVTGRSGTIGQVQLVDGPYWPLNTALWSKELRRASAMLAYFILKEMDFSGLQGGAAVPTLNRNHLHARQLPIPPRNLVTTFDDTVAPMFGLKRTLEKKNEVLRQTRDLLLPKLISGEIDVDALDLPEEPARSGPHRREVRGEIDGDALDLLETA